MRPSDLLKQCAGWIQETLYAFPSREDEDKYFKTDTAVMIRGWSPFSCKYCLIGVVYAWDRMQENHGKEPMDGVILQAVADELCVGHTIDPLEGIGEWNDQSGRTMDEVLEVLMAAERKVFGETK